MYEECAHVVRDVCTHICLYFLLHKHYIFTHMSFCVKKEHSICIFYVYINKPIEAVLQKKKFKLVVYSILNAAHMCVICVVIINIEDFIVVYVMEYIGSILR